MPTNLRRNVVLAALLAAGALAAVLTVSSVAQATGQEERQKMMWSEEMPQINGSVNVGNEMRSFINDNVKVSFVQAAETAQAQVADGKVIAGHLGVVQGFLVYSFFVANTANQTGYLNVIDAGNGEVLYSSEGMPLASFGYSQGHWGGHGYGGWLGHGKSHGFGWGMWR